jgi:hypothetical protein
MSRRPNENIIEASLQALVDSLECGLLKTGSSARPKRYDLFG